ncbi:MAG: hypothetical protein ACOCXT_01255 [Candidatus Dojkabacteria bacterium]
MQQGKTDQTSRIPFAQSINNILHSHSRKLGYDVLLDTIFWIIVGTFEIALIYRLATLREVEPLTEITKYYIILFITTFLFFLFVPKVLVNKNSQKQFCHE